MPIAMTPDQYFYAFVRGNYYDCLDNQGCVRRAFNAAVSASHMADHWFEYYKIHDLSKINQFNKIGDLINHISYGTNGYFTDIRSIANAYKHLYTGVHPIYSQYSSISSAGTIEAIHLTGGNIQAINEGTSKVVYTRKSGQQLDFLSALRAVVQYWEQEFF
jgi:hypothetical protein